MENVQRKQGVCLQAHTVAKPAVLFLFGGLSAAMSISVIPMMAEISVGEKNYDTQIVSQDKDYNRNHY